MIWISQLLICYIKVNSFYWIRDFKMSLLSCNPQVSTVSKKRTLSEPCHSIYEKLSDSKECIYISSALLWELTFSCDFSWLKAYIISKKKCPGSPMTKEPLNCTVQSNWNKILLYLYVEQLMNHKSIDATVEWQN